MLPLSAALPSDSPWVRQPEVLTSLRGLLEEQPRPANYAQVLNAASSFQRLMQEPAMRDQVLAGLNDTNPEVQRAAVRVCLEHFLGNAQTAPLVKTAFANLNPQGMGMFVEEVGDPKFLKPALRHCGWGCVAGSGLHPE